MAESVQRRTRDRVMWGLFVAAAVVVCVAAVMGVTVRGWWMWVLTGGLAAAVAFVIYVLCTEPDD